MNRLIKIVVAVVIAVVIVLAARHFGLLDPVAHGGQVISLFVSTR